MSNEPEVMQLSEDLWKIFSYFLHHGEANNGFRDFPPNKSTLYARRLWGDPMVWYISLTPDAPTTFPKPRYKALTTKRYADAETACQAAKEWLQEREALSRLGGGL
jgi:hypothetical protein